MADYTNSSLDVLKKQLESVSLVQFVAPNGSSRDDDQGIPDMHISILRHKCKLMKAEIDSLNDNTLQLLPKDDEIRFEVLKKDLTDRLSQYKECCTFLQVQRKQMNEDIEREEKVQEELKAIVSAAELKLQETAQQEQSKNEVYDRLKKKCQTIDTINNETKRNLRTFLDTHFPLPDQEMLSKFKKRIVRHDVHLIKLDTLLSLKDIIQELVNACLNSPNDPYIATDFRYWPPYIELLLQCDIILRHPSDSERIKLMPFHL